MICLHRLRGDELWVNPDLIVFAEHTGHDTIVTLADGNRVTVTEPVEAIASACIQFRSTVLAAADNLSTIFTHAERSVADRTDRIDRTERAERTDRVDRTERAERAERLASGNGPSRRRGSVEPC